MTWFDSVEYTSEVLLAGLKSLTRFGGHERRSSQRSYSGLANVSLDATLSSIKHTHAVLELAIKTMQKLVDLLRRFMALRARDAQCPQPLLPETCLQLEPLFRGAPRAEEALASLIELKQVQTFGPIYIRRQQAAPAQPEPAANSEE